MKDCESPSDIVCGEQILDLETKVWAVGTATGVARHETLKRVYGEIHYAQHRKANRELFGCMIDLLMGRAISQELG